MSRVRIDIEEIKALQKRRKEINAIELADIDFYENGVKVVVSSPTVEDWNFVGLSNIDFIEHAEYAPESIPEPVPVWKSLSERPEKPCLARFRLANGEEERGRFEKVWRKDGLEICPIGANGFLAIWRFGGDHIVEWTERQE